MNKGLIENAVTPEGGDARRKLYAMTDAGRHVLRAEMQRLEELLENGRKVFA